MHTDVVFLDILGEWLDNSLLLANEFVDEETECSRIGGDHYKYSIIKTFKIRIDIEDFV